MAVVTNGAGYEFRVIPGQSKEKSDFILAGYKFRKGYFHSSEPSMFELCMALEDLTSTSKDDRQYGKNKVRDWADDGKAIYELAIAAIEEAQS